MLIFFLITLSVELLNHWIMSKNILAYHQHWDSLSIWEIMYFPTGHSSETKTVTQHFKCWLWQLSWTMCSSWNGFHKEEFLGNKAFKVSKIYSLEKERQGCEEKLDDANGDTNKLLWHNFRLELYQDNCLYASFLPHHKYYFFYHVSLWAGTVVQLVHHSSMFLHICSYS